MKDRIADLNPTEQGRRLMDTARGLSSRAQDVAGDLVGDARQQVERFTGRDIDAWTEDLKSFVQKRPLQAVLITVAVGYVLGKMLKRG